MRFDVAIKLMIWTLIDEFEMTRATWGLYQSNDTNAYRHEMEIVHATWDIHQGRDMKNYWHGI